MNQPKNRFNGKNLNLRNVRQAPKKPVVKNNKKPVARRLAVSNLPKKTKMVGNTTLRMWQGDITKLQVGAIVNAADEDLTGGGGIDRIIQNAAGNNVKLQCKKLSCKLGKAVVTSGGNLPCKKIIHTVGPDLRLDAKDRKGKTLKKNGKVVKTNNTHKPTKGDIGALVQCYISCMKECEKNHISSVAFCCLSCGTYGFPKKEAAEIACNTVKGYIAAHPQTCVKDVVFCAGDKAQLGFYNAAA
ncbi:MAG: macro domain-containing protein [Puniceicoccales bacterium]|nr:macro domain-containing protein [Puniceicoccales bacterium]